MGGSGAQGTGGSRHLGGGRCELELIAWTSCVSHYGLSLLFFFNFWLPRIFQHSLHFYWSNIKSPDSRKPGNRCNLKGLTILRGYMDWSKKQCLFLHFAAPTAPSVSLRGCDVFISKTNTLISLSFTCYLSLTHHFNSANWVTHEHISVCVCVLLFV